MQTVAVMMLYAIFESLIRLLETACSYIANKILDATVTVFSSGQNIFSTFVNLIPFSSGIDLPAIVTGLSYGIVVILMLISILRSFVSPLTGDDAVNPAQAFIRAALTVVLIVAVFGTSFASSSGTVFYKGLLGVIGEWFGAVLSKTGSVPSMKFTLAFKWNPAEYAAAILLDLALITSIVGAALQYVERIVSFAVYIIFGPVAVAMYASRDTADVCRQWLTGLLSEFLSLILSLVMWISFVEAANSARVFGESLLHYAVMIAILGIMRNSEKIINVMGFRTISLGDSARAMIAGAGLATSSVMMLSRFSTGRAAGKGGGATGGSHVLGAGSPYGWNSGFGNSLSTRLNQMDSVNSAVFSSVNPLVSSHNTVGAIRNASRQSRAVSEVRNAINSGDAISASTFNQAMGFGNGTAIHAAGNELRAVSVQTAQGSTINGFLGDAVINRGSQMEIARDVFFPVSSEQAALQPGMQVNPYTIGSDGSPVYAETPRFIADGGIALDSKGNYAYRTAVSYDDMKNSAPASAKSRIVDASGNPVASTADHPGRSR